MWTIIRPEKGKLKMFQKNMRRFEQRLRDAGVDNRKLLDEAAAEIEPDADGIDVVRRVGRKIAENIYDNLSTDAALLGVFTGDPKEAEEKTLRTYAKTLRIMARQIERYAEESEKIPQPQTSA
jgi:hypothetical protein